MYVTLNETLQMKITTHRKTWKTNRSKSNSISNYSVQSKCTS